MTRAPEVRLTAHQQEALDELVRLGHQEAQGHARRLLDNLVTKGLADRTILQMQPRVAAYTPTAAGADQTTRARVIRRAVAVQAMRRRIPR